MEVTQVSSRVVYADAEGAVHMGLPVYIDDTGACHAGCVEQAAEDAAVVSTIFDGTATTDSSAAEKKLMVERVVEQAMQVEEISEDGERRRKVRAIMKRLQTSPSGRSLEEKDALRRAIIYDRTLRRQASADSATTSQNICFLTAAPMPLLLPSVF
ncbi:hypothetical protein CLOP_g1013 [Closterium sp. NIES-67]|nr:hypothetical protein CLOP_g1013 [Closterium sp. NIES-67]